MEKHKNYFDQFISIHTLSSLILICYCTALHTNDKIHLEKNSLATHHKKNTGTVESQDIQFHPSSESQLSIQISLNVCLI